MTNDVEHLFMCLFIGHLSIFFGKKVCSGSLPVFELGDFLFVCFGPHCTARGILVPPPGIEPVSPAVEVQSPNHWTTREFPGWVIFIEFGELKK